MLLPRKLLTLVQVEDFSLRLILYSIALDSIQKFFIFVVDPKNDSMHLMYVEEDGKRKYTLKKVLGEDYCPQPQRLKDLPPLTQSRWSCHKVGSSKSLLTGRCVFGTFGNLGSSERRLLIKRHSGIVSR